MVDDVQIDPVQFLVAIIDSQDCEVRVPYAVFAEQKGEKVLTIDFEDDGATIVLRLLDKEDVIQDVATGTIDV